MGATPSGLTSAHLHHPPYFLQAGWPSCRPTNSINAAKALQHKINTKKLKPGLVASYDIWPGNGQGLFWFWRFINLSLTFLIRHLPTYVQPQDPHRAQQQVRACKWSRSILTVVPVQPRTCIADPLCAKISTYRVTTGIQNMFHITIRI